MKRRFGLIFFSLISMSYAFAGANSVEHLSLRCETPWPTASVLLETLGDKVRMKLDFHYGPGRIPLRVDSVVPDDIQVIVGNANLVRQLNRHQEFEWSLDRCTGNSSGLIRCTQGQSVAQAMESNLKVDNVLLFTSRTFENQLSVNRARFNVELWITVNASVLRLAIPYDQKDCLAQVTPRKSP